MTRLTTMAAALIMAAAIIVFSLPQPVAAQSGNTRPTAQSEPAVSTTALTFTSVTDSGTFASLRFYWSARSTSTASDRLRLCGVYVHAASQEGGTDGPWGDYWWTSTFSARVSYGGSFYFPLPTNGYPFDGQSTLAWQLRAYPIFGTASECADPTNTLSYSTYGTTNTLSFNWTATDYVPAVPGDVQAYVSPDVEDSITLKWTAANRPGCCSLDVTSYAMAVAEYCLLPTRACTRVTPDSYQWEPITVSANGKGSGDLGDYASIAAEAHIKVVLAARSEVGQGPAATAPGYVLWGDGTQAVPASSAVSGPEAHNNEGGLLTFWTTDDSTISVGGGPTLAHFGGLIPAALVQNTAYDQPPAALTPVLGGGTPANRNIYIELKPADPDLRLEYLSTWSTTGIELRVKLPADPSDAAHVKRLIEYYGSLSDFVASTDGRGWRIEVPRSWEPYFNHGTAHRPQVELQIVVSCLVPARTVELPTDPMIWAVFGEWYCPANTYTSSADANDVLYGPMPFSIQLPEAGAVVVTEGTADTELWVLPSKPPFRADATFATAAQILPGTTGKLLDLAAGEHWLAIGAPDSHLTSPRSYSVRLTRVATAGVYGQAPDLSHWGAIETNGNKGIDGRWTDQYASDTHGYHIRITYTRPSGTTSTVYDQGNTSRFNLVVPDDTTSVDAEVRGWVFGGASGVTLSDGRSVPVGTIWVTQWSSPQTMAWQPGQQPSALGGAGEPEPTITAALGVPLQNTLELLDAEDSYGPEWLILIALGAALGAALLVWSVLKRTAMAATAGLILGGLIWMGLGPRLFGVPDVAAYMPVVILGIFATLVLVRSFR